jgi:hypothetical protein
MFDFSFLLLYYLETVAFFITGSYEEWTRK